MWFVVADIASVSSISRIYCFARSFFDNTTWNTVSFAGVFFFDETFYLRSLWKHMSILEDNVQNWMAPVQFGWVRMCTPIQTEIGSGRASDKV